MITPRLRDYMDCVEKWKTVRSKEKGKPISSAVRMFWNANGSFELKQWGISPLATIYPNNTIELKFAAYPPNKMHEIVPIYEANIGKKLYRVDHSLNVPKGAYGYPDHIHMTKVAPEYFPGIKFDMATGECLNRRLDRNERMDYATNTNWKRDLGKFRKNMMARAKLGAFDSLVAEFAFGSRSYHPGMPLDEFLAAFAASMRGDEYPADFIQEFVRLSIYRARYGDNTSITQKVDRTLTSLVDSNRIALKQHYGVYSPQP